MSSSRIHAPKPQKAGVRPVSQPDDRHEREAERAADVVARGGSVAGWSFSAVTAFSPPAQRQEVGKEKSEDEKKKEALKKAGEAALKTPQGQALKEKVLDDPVVKTVKDAVTSTPGVIATVGAAAGGIAALAATGKELPFQPPEIPLDKIKPGLAAQVTYEGPVNAPTFVGLTVKYTAPKAKGAKKPSPYADEIARLKAQERMFRPVGERAAEKQAEEEMVAAWIAQQQGFTIPLPTPPPKKKEEATPAQPAPASPTAAPPGHSNVDGALSTPGRQLDPPTRRTMEARFGYDFSGVRIHDDARAAAVAASIDAAAFTVGQDVVFGAERYDPDTPVGRRLLAHELAHVVQQSAPPTHRGRGAHPVSRKVVVKGTEMTPKARGAFLTARKWASRTVAKSVLDDMADAGDTFDFTDEAELTTEVVKRVATAEHIVESQQTVEKIPGDKRTAFGYPFSGLAILYGPRVNYAARELWRPAPPDDYALRRDKTKNKTLLGLPRHERFRVYGDQGSSYSWVLTDKGKADPYSAIALLFVPQPPHRRTLLHCDYLISIVNFMSLADSIGKVDFNKRIAAFGAGRIRLRFDAFTDLHPVVFEAIVGKGMVQRPGLQSMQRVRPTSERDFVIGDHVVFFNHMAYDLINERIGNAWRLENAVVVRREPKGDDIFLGHGSGRKTTRQMRDKLAEEFNDVARLALALTSKAASKDTAIATKAQADLSAKFPRVTRVSGDWRIFGAGRLCATVAVNEKLRTIKGAEVIGPRDPCDRTKMYVVERPVESAKGKP